MGASGPNDSGSRSPLLTRFGGIEGVPRAERALAPGLPRVLLRRACRVAHGESDSPRSGFRIVVHGRVCDAAPLSTRTGPSRPLGPPRAVEHRASPLRSDDTANCESRLCGGEQSEAAFIVAVRRAA